ncbi:MAG: nitrite reductase [Pseudodesulfovibrio sp.]|uniref:Nitrite reductase (NAD(P)H) n=1 Tax=Pseudodesulfovibrio aespoeensis (strain ATCC 700646 / DSM 10631 / Aspo-2) TaxID=643562 RepID=E6VYH1_PSEA9|nr:MULTISPECIES: nitrite reductase [Pseudodesulfovibrio]MBU4244703.1 nitrite reductase [Pseudomonadota bacterium]ADU62734.1 Nitrite reductase (NAD(P)H) [Pseudodesulfovibrio aespoeensis Aspo-2]MBU4379908.1 nitrite reductase [Pseudomonadota bacterium]MBU4474215.1 nitrite reductase [Pseudomonadota bacterium]MBU4515671.1 nitrite reductase [Pseudomonadota bacterium]
MKSDALPEGVQAQRQEGLYSVTPRLALGRINPEQLNIINAVVQEFRLPGVRVTAGQRLKLQGIPGDRLDEVIRHLGPVGEFCKYYVQACPGVTSCRLAMQDSMDTGARLEEFLNTFTLPAKVKAGVSGCSMCCSESFVRDIGLVGKKQGWTVIFGGNAGKRVRVGDVLAEDVSNDEALRVIGQTLAHYAANGRKRERTARFVERVGIKAVMAAIS